MALKTEAERRQLSNRVADDRDDEAARRYCASPKFRCLVDWMLKMMNESAPPVSAVEMAEALECAININRDEHSGSPGFSFADNFTIDLEALRAEDELKQGIQDDLIAQRDSEVAAMINDGQAGIVTAADVRRHIEQVLPAHMRADVSIDSAEPGKVKIGVVKRGK